MAIRVLTALAVLVLAFGVAFADDDKAKAKQLVTDALAAQDEGRYDDAIELYNQAYDLVPHPEILFNLGQAYRLKGDKPTALGYYKKYLAVEAKGRVAKDAKKWADKLEKEIAEDARKAEKAKKAEEARLAEEARVAEEAKQAEAAAKAEAARQAEEARKAEAARQAEEARRAEEARTTDEPTEPQNGPDDPPRHGPRFRVAAIATGAAGLALVGTGVFFGLQARSIDDELSHHDGAWTEELLAKDATGARDEKLMFVFTGVGVAAIATGAVLFVLGRGDSSEPAEITLVPTIGPDRATVSIRGWFE